jgi:leader peptidase (prepilin peptidase)/N-methyltransferase
MMIFLSLLLGASFGSFFGVCVHRIPKGKSIISPSSYCPQCKNKIRWYDNIPFLSYCLLRGRCRFCQKRIPLTDLLIEFVTTAVFAGTYMKFGLSAQLPVYLVFFSLLIIGSFIDMELQIIPDVITIPGTVVGLSLSFLTIGLLGSLLGAAVGTLIVGLFAVLGKSMFKKEAMGGGDVKLLAMIGAFTGWVDVLWVLFLGSLLGLVFALARRQRVLPFGPFLSAAAFIIIIVGGFSAFLLGM